MFRVHYFRIGIEGLRPVTADEVEKRGLVCCFKAPQETAELTKILASGTPPTVPEDMFADSAVRVKIVEVTDASENAIAVVEDKFDVRRGVVRRGGVDRVLSASAMDNLKRVIETRCWAPEPYPVPPAAS